MHTAAAAAAAATKQNSHDTLQTNFEIANSGHVESLKNRVL
jgi:hypothetical protein